MNNFTIRLFGLFETQLNDQPVNEFRSNKARGLLAYLATEANRPIARTTLATLFWGDYPDAQARKSLRNTVANLRQMLAPVIDAGHLLIDRQTIQLMADDEHSQIDVAQFDELISTAQKVTSTQSTYELLTQAVSIYQGEFLAGLPATDSTEFEAWRVFQQEVRHRQMMDALHTMTEYAIQQQNHATAAQSAHRQIQLEPWHEQAHTQLMQIFAAQGDRSAALNQFATLKKVLEEEMGMPPSAEAAALSEQIRSGAGAMIVPNQSAGSASNNAPSVASVDIRSLQTEQSADALGQESGQKLEKESAEESLDRERQSSILSLLPPLSSQTLFGVDSASARINRALTEADRPWLVAIDGIGGIGKTTLATLLVHSFLDLTRFEDIAWVSAKQEEYGPTGSIVAIDKPALDVESLTDNLLEQLMPRPPRTAWMDEKRATLMQLLKERPHLVVVDNLETVADYQALVPFLRQLANPSKFLITTRFSLQSYSDIFCYSLTELAEEDALAFLQHEVEICNHRRLSNATTAQLQEIYQVVGGNPLALKLVLGQVNFLSLTQVLENLRAATGKKVDQLYRYIYWQAWEMLDEVARQLFLAMPAVDDGTFLELSFAAGLEADDVQDALGQLMDLSLIQVGGDLEDPRYRLHRLTETFLMNEVLKWQA